MIYGYARISTDGQNVASGARADRNQALADLTAGEVRRVTRLDRLARLTRDASRPTEITRSCNVSHSTISRLTA
jgi:DNA invertase Pin-like site-specific DNA recombinase